MPSNQRMFERLRRLFSAKHREARLQERLAELQQRLPMPVFWLFGKTQSGKTSVIKFLTGADEAEIGQGFRPCTRHSRQYLFPTQEAPLLTFLDTRGLEEPNYDPEDDLARFNHEAHVVLVTVKALDHARDNLLRHLRTVRDARPGRPIVLLLTCLHESYPQQQHPQPYPFDHGLEKASGAPQDLRRTLEEQQRSFQGLADHIVPVDLTKPEEGFAEPHYGGAHLKRTVLDVLPAAYRQTLLTLDEAMRDLQDLSARNALPHIVGYSSLAATAGAIPIPWLDLLVLPGIQTRMIYHLAQLYGQPLSGTRFIELASTLGLGMMMRQATREMLKLIPYVGSVFGSALAGASTYALGKAFCHYYSAVHQGHVPRAEDLKRYYREQLASAEKMWQGKGGTP